MLPTDFNPADEEKFPWEDIEASRQNAQLQADKNAEWAAKRYGKGVACPKCSLPAKELTWFYFCSPGWTWEHLCGREGWIAVCDQCKVQVFFHCVALN